ncbi:AAA family ATPase [bacterium]|nr:AAA family ATPase [bacterium]
MIRIKDLTVKNFMSVGNQTQAVDFNKAKLTLVLGENLDQGGDDSGSRNGTGKTTIINALSYALYGTALTNIKRNNLINKTNSKGMVVSLDFEKDNIQYKIERGRSPTFFKFFINNEEQIDDESQGDSRKTQEYLNDLLGMSHDMFKHIVALNTYSEPFLSMRVNDQRAIIEQLLGITILSEKADNLKEQVRNTKDAITQETLKIEATQTANSKIESTIASLQSNQKAWLSKRTTDTIKLKEAINELEHLDIEVELESHEKLSNWNEHNNAILALKKELSTLEPALQRADKSADKLTKDIADLEDAKCYTCGQDLHADKKAEIAERKKKELEDALAYQTEISGKLLEVTKGLKDIGDINGKPSVFYDTAKEAYEHRQNVDSLKQAYESKKDEQDPYEAQINELNESAIQEIDWTPVNELTTYKEHQDFMLKLLTNKDSFIRKKIIEQNLMYLNNRLTYYLDRLGLPHQVVFQNDLVVEITQLGQDLDFDNLSRGERNRLILGLSFAFRDVWESLYQNINLLFIDELIDSGMDTAGVESSLSVLKKMAREREKNIYLISHKDELVGRVNTILKVVKENGFTSYENDVEVVE